MANASPDVYVGRNAVDPQGDKIGSVGEVYLNDQTGQPDWVTINTGFFGMRESFAPLAGSTLDGDDLVLPFDKAFVKDAPDVADVRPVDTGPAPVTPRIKRPASRTSPGIAVRGKTRPARPPTPR